MEDVYSIAYQEVYSVISIMPEELLKQIPTKFIDMIEKKRSKSYITSINSIDDIENANFREETIIILGLIYRDFLCSPEERKEIQAEDLKRQKEEKEKYDSDNIFKTEKTENIEEKEEVVSLTQAKEKSLFSRFIAKIKSFFSKA